MNVEKNICKIFKCKYNITFNKCLLCDKKYNYYNHKEVRIITINKNMYHISCYFKNNKFDKNKYVKYKYHSSFF